MLEIVEPQQPIMPPAEFIPGTRILVSEYPNGKVWHTVVSCDAQFVYTKEVPEGFSRVFILGEGTICESCGVAEGTRHLKECG
jgi:hypothetical protein